MAFSGLQAKTPKPHHAVCSMMLFKWIALPLQDPITPLSSMASTISPLIKHMLQGNFCQFLPQTILLFFMIGLWQQEHEVAAHFCHLSLSWGLHCILSFTIIASDPGHIRVPCRASNPATQWLGSVTFWSLIVKFCNIHTLASFMPGKSTSHVLCLVSLLARDAAYTSWITAPVASVSVWLGVRKHFPRNPCRCTLLWRPSLSMQSLYKWQFYKWIWIAILFLCLAIHVVPSFVYHLCWPTPAHVT